MSKRISLNNRLTSETYVLARSLREQPAAVAGNGNRRNGIGLQTVAGERGELCRTEAYD